MFNNPFDAPPAFVNEAGVKWWPDADINRWIMQKENLPGYQGFLVETLDGKRTRLLVHPDRGVVNETGNVEAMSAYVDMLHLENCIPAAVLPKETKRK